MNKIFTKQLFAEIMVPAALCGAIVVLIAFFLGIRDPILDMIGIATTIVIGFLLRIRLY